MTKINFYRLIFCAVLIIVSIFLLFHLQTYDDPMGASYTTLRTTFMPKLCCISLLGLSLLYGIQIYLNREKEEMGKKGKDSIITLKGKKLFFARIGTIVIMVIYIFFFEKINFLVLNSIFMFLMLYLYGKRNILQTTAISVLSGVSFYLLFVVGLKLSF